jgi:hypothetical protein
MRMESCCRDRGERMGNVLEVGAGLAALAATRRLGRVKNDTGYGGLR